MCIAVQFFIAPPCTWAQCRHTQLLYTATSHVQRHAISTLPIDPVLCRSSVMSSSIFCEPHHRLSQCTWLQFILWIFSSHCSLVILKTTPESCTHLESIDFQSIESTASTSSGLISVAVKPVIASAFTAWTSLAVVIEEYGLHVLLTISRNGDR